MLQILDLLHNPPITDSTVEIKSACLGLELMYIYV